MQNKIFRFRDFFENDPDDNNSDKDKSKDSLIPRFFLSSSSVAIPAGAELLTLHRLPDSSSRIIAVFRLADGALASLPVSLSSPDNVSAGREPQFISDNLALRFTDTAFPRPDSLFSLGNHLILLINGEIFYSLRHDTEDSGWFTAPEKLPDPCSLSYTVSGARIPEFMASDDSLPRLNISMPCKPSLEKPLRDWLSGNPVEISGSDRDFSDAREELTRRLAQSFNSFRLKVKDAGLFLFPIALSARVVLNDNSAILYSDPVVASSPLISGGIALILADASVANGIISLAIEVSRRPVRISATLSNSRLPLFLSGTARSLQLLTSPEFPDIAADNSGLPVIGGLSRLTYFDGETPVTARGWTLPTRNSAVNLCDKIFSPNISSAPSFSSGDSSSLPLTLVADASLIPDSSSAQPVALPDRPSAGFHPSGGRVINSSLFLFDADRLAVSRVANPFCFNSPGIIEGEKIITLLPSLRALSSGQLGEFPLYAFCADGIRALSPSPDGGFRSVQLISRDFPCRNLFALTPSAVIFASPRGILSLEGSSVRLIGSDEFRADFSDPDSMEYFYPEDTLIITKGVKTGFIRLKDSYEGVFPVHRKLMSLSPLLFVISESNRLHLLSRELVSSLSPSIPDSTDPDLSPSPSSFRSPPLPVDDGVSRRHIRGCAIIPPDVSISSFLLEVSDDRTRWYPLLLSQPVSLIFGRAWRFCRLSISYDGTGTIPEGLLLRLD